MKRVRWGFIGCGDVVERKSGPAFSEVEGSAVVAVMSRSRDKARGYAERHGIGKWFTDAQQLIDDPEVNAVYIATPPSSHAPYAIMAMRAGKPVYVEKPLAATYDDCARINRVSEQTGVPCFVAYYRRYLPYFQRVKDIIDSGRIGKTVSVAVRFATPPWQLDYDRPETLPWRLVPDISGGGYFYDLAPHQMDFLQHLFGVIIEARGICSNRAGLYQPEDSVAAIFEFEDGLPGSGSWSFVGHESAREDRIQIVGTMGELSFSVFSYDPIVLHTSQGTETVRVENPTYVQYPIVKTVVEHLQGRAVCQMTSVAATPTNWVLYRILGKI
ncbi:MAG: Gfo/Idh/MocA family oxidoreductase [Prevotella sp.]|nr:Gfo/Idh/MocA family oxidoreductase [Prevotella sp.]